MAGRSIFPRYGSGTTSGPVIQSLGYTTGQTFKAGALLLLQSTGLVSVCGADPTVVSAVALQPAGYGPGFNMADSPTVVTGRNQEVSCAIANRMTVYSCRGVNGATDPVTPAVTNIDEQYGAAADSDGVWVLDIAEVTAKVFEVVDVDIPNKIFFVKFLEAVLSLP